MFSTFAAFKAGFKMSGVMMSSTNEVMMAPKAPPTITATAKSSILPLNKKAFKSFNISYLYGGPTEKKSVEAFEEPVSPLKEIKPEILASPLTGRVVTLADVPDEVFASGAMGNGIAIEPSEGLICAPTNAEVTLVFPTGHALGLRTENGAELLIHIGMDTVSLDGKGFETFVQVGDKVSAGQKLSSFDLDVIKAAGLPIITPIIVTNTADFTDILVIQESQVNTGDYLLTAVK